jgi:hypothetical protein
VTKNNIMRVSAGSSKESQIIWRREKVLKYASLGYSQGETAEILKVTQPTISKDIAYLSKAARNRIKDHIEVKIPFEREKTLMLFENIKRKALDISEKENLGERDRLSALTLVKDVGKEIWALQIQGEHVKKALKVAGGLQEKLESLEQNEEMEQEQQEQQEQEEEEESPPLYDHEG